MSCGQGRNDGGKGAQFPGRRIIMGAPKSPNNFTSTFFNTVNFLPKDFRFENGAAKLASCPGRRLTSLRSCTCNSRILFFTLDGRI